MQRTIAAELWKCPRVDIVLHGTFSVITIYKSIVPWPLFPMFINTVGRDFFHIAEYINKLRAGLELVDPLPYPNHFRVVA